MVEKQALVPVCIVNPKELLLLKMLKCLHVPNEFVSSCLWIFWLAHELKSNIFLVYFYESKHTWICIKTECWFELRRFITSLLTIYIIIFKEKMKTIKYTCILKMLQHYIGNRSGPLWGNVYPCSVQTSYENNLTNQQCVMLVSLKKLYEQVSQTRNCIMYKNTLQESSTVTHLHFERTFNYMAKISR